MAYSLAFTDKFKKAYKKLTAKEQKLVDKKLLILADNPLHPSLRTKRIQSTENLFECSVNMDIRIVWYFEADTIIILLDVGHHNIFNKY